MKLNAAAAGLLLLATAGCADPRAFAVALGVSQDAAEGARRSDLNQRLNEAADQHPDVVVSIGTPTFYQHTHEGGTWELTGDVRVDLSVVLASVTRDITFRCSVDRQGRASAYTAGLN